MPYDEDTDAALCRSPQGKELSLLPTAIMESEPPAICQARELSRKDLLTPIKPSGDCSPSGLDCNLMEILSQKYLAKLLPHS